MTQVTFEIDGMNCAHCVHAVESALQAIPSVEVRGVHIGSATVAFDPATATVGALVDAIADAGYEARERAEPA